jgi:hypothetical protein
VLIDGVFLGTANTFNATEPAPYLLTITAPPGPFAITETVYHPATGDVFLRWTSVTGASYAVDQTMDPASPGWTAVQSGFGSGGLETSTSFTVPAAERRLQFFKVRRENP